MTAHDPSFHRRSGKSILGWLRGNAPDDLRHADDPPPETPGEDPYRMARRQLLGDIGEFLLAHDLDLSAFTLAVAFNYLTGSDGQMMRRIDARLATREPVTLEWLETSAREAGDQGDTVTRLMHRLESNIAAFETTSSAAKAAASDYNSALSAHVDGMGEAAAPQQSDSTMMVQELVDLARSMLSRTAVLEQEMARSMLETRALRRNLEQARRSAEEDHLTGLPNRRAFEARYDSEFAAARAAGDQLAVAFCDIDNFKRVNDEHGHEAGDRVLKTVATALSRISDDRCHVARHGGEEFVILLRGRSLHQAWELLDDARAALAERRMVNRANDTPFGKITFSAGIADVFAYPDPRSALRGADHALLRAKAEGRNKVVVASNDIGSNAAIEPSTRRP